MTPTKAERVRSLEQKINQLDPLDRRLIELVVEIFRRNLMTSDEVKAHMDTVTGSDPHLFEEHVRLAVAVFEEKLGLSG